MENTLSLTPEEVLDHVGYDYRDERVNQRAVELISTAHAYLVGALGDDYPYDDPRVKEIAYAIIDDLWEKRGFIEVTGNVRKLISNLELQVRMDMRRKKIEIST